MSTSNSFCYQQVEQNYFIVYDNWNLDECYYLVSQKAIFCLNVINDHIVDVIA